jgi:hypothetical protein
VKKQLRDDKIPTTEDTEEHRERKNPPCLSMFSVVKKNLRTEKLQTTEDTEEHRERKKNSVPLCVLRGKKNPSVVKKKTP